MTGEEIVRCGSPNTKSPLVPRFLTPGNITFVLIWMWAGPQVQCRLMGKAKLASIVAFRKDYIKGDLQRHDALTLATLGKMSAYINIDCIKTGKPDNLGDCVTDKDRLWEQGASDLTVLQRQSELRGFHLQLFEDQLVELIDRLKR